MALRILSGMLFINGGPKNGTAVLSFNPFELTNAPATVSLNVGKFLDDKIRAFQAHTSQAPLFPLFENGVRQRGSREEFHLAATSTPGRLKQETDLFQGVVEDGKIDD